MLISDSGEPLLCDFGFSRIRHEITRTHTIVREGGRMRFLAPELLDGPEYFQTSKESDVYSLSLVFLSTWARKPPFAEHPNERAAGAAVRRGERPQRPPDDILKEIACDDVTIDLFWSLLGEMWAHDPSDRPSAHEVESKLDALFDVQSQTSPLNVSTSNTNNVDVYSSLPPGGGEPWDLPATRLEPDRAVQNDFDAVKEPSGVSPEALGSVIRAESVRSMAGNLSGGDSQHRRYQHRGGGRDDRDSSELTTHESANVAGAIERLNSSLPYPTLDSDGQPPSQQAESSTQTWVAVTRDKVHIHNTVYSPLVQLC